MVLFASGSSPEPGVEMVHFESKPASGPGIGMVHFADACAYRTTVRRLTHSSRAIRRWDHPRACMHLIAS
jgi:hypothetical protein